MILHISKLPSLSCHPAFSLSLCIYAQHCSSGHPCWHFVSVSFHLFHFILLQNSIPWLHPWVELRSPCLSQGQTRLHWTCLRIPPCELTMVDLGWTAAKSLWFCGSHWNSSFQDSFTDFSSRRSQGRSLGLHIGFDMFACLLGVKCYFIIVLIWISLITCGTEHCFMCISPSGFLLG